MISEDAEESLKDYFTYKRGNEFLDWHEEIDKAYTAAKKCLKDMTFCARSDLKIND